MLSLFSTALFATICSSHFIPPLLSRSVAESLLSVQLYPVDTSSIKAIISNRGNTDLRILKPGSILDAQTFSKLQVTQNGKHICFHPSPHKISDSQPGAPVTFRGVIPNFAADNWGSEHFITIPAGQTAENTIDLSAAHDLGVGGMYQVVVNSILHHVQGDSNKLVGSIPYQTNTLSLDIAKTVAKPSSFPLPTLNKRTRLYPDCTPQQLNNLTRAAYLGAAWAGAGAYEALKMNSPM